VPGVAEDLNVALELADVADRITMSRFRAADLVVETKPDLTPVSEADTAVERAIREMLAEVRPDDGVLGEEYGAPAEGGARRWIVDPIDGTKGYVRAIPVWATLLALHEDGEASVAVVSAPAMGRRWWAARGTGAFTDDGLSDGNRPLRVSAIGSLLPPPYTETWTGRFPRAIAALDRVERRFETLWPLPALADHYLMELERR